MLKLDGTTYYVKFTGLTYVMFMGPDAVLSFYTGIDSGIEMYWKLPMSLPEFMEGCDSSTRAAHLMTMLAAYGEQVWNKNH
jgi:hypothetical protein